MFYLYDGTPTNNPEDIKYINRLLNQLAWKYYNFHKKVVHYDYQYDESHVSEDWTKVTSRKVIKDTINKDILIPNNWGVTIELLKDQVVYITISINPADTIEYTLTPLNREQWKAVYHDIYGEEEDADITTL